MEDIIELKMEDNNKEILKKENIYLLACSIVLGVLADVLFYGKYMGVSYPVFIIAFYLVFLWNSRSLTHFRFSFEWLLSIPIFMLSLTYMIFSNQMFHVLNFIGIPVLIIAQTTLLTGKNKHKWFCTGFIKDLLYSAFNRVFSGILKPAEMLLELIRKRTYGNRYTNAFKVFAGLLISIPLVLVLITLLASADQVFEYFLGNIPKMFENINIDEFIAQMLIILIIAATTFSYIYNLINRQVPNTNDLVEEKSSAKGLLDPVIVVTILFVINTIYLMFVFIQFTYLFGGLNYSLPPEFTYAEYARRGFFELVAVTLINLTILLCTINLTKGKDKVAYKITRILNTLLVVSTLILLYSAHSRMSLYEETYGYTYLRVLTHLFMVFIFALLVATFYKIWVERMLLLKAYIIIALISYVVINYANIDSFIARENIERYKNNKSIDIQYLADLSTDAVPLLVPLMDDRNGMVAQRVENYLYIKKQELADKNHWQSFNIADYRAKSILEGLDLQYQAEEAGDYIR